MAQGAGLDHARLAATLSAATGTTLTAMQLPFQQIEFTARMDSVSFDVGTGLAL